MKSKTFSFNMALFRKNIGLYWPILAVYALALLAFVPGYMWYRFQNVKNWKHTIEKWDAYEVIGKSMDMQMGILLVAAMAVVTAMALFHYLFQARSANMLHAFPVTRGELYLTNVVSGLVFILLPLVLTFLVAVLVCLGFGAPYVEYLGIWLLSMCGAGIFFFGLSVFCAMITGQLFAVPLYFMVINFICVGIRLLFQNVISSMGCGLTFSGSGRQPLDWLSPLYYLFKSTNFQLHYAFNQGFLTGDGSVSAYQCDGIYFSGGGILIIYAIVGLLLVVAGYQIYRIRQVEKAGDLVIFSHLRPLVRWGIGLLVGALGACVVHNVLDGMFNWVNGICFLLLWLVFTAISYLVAQMILEKKCKIFTKRLLGEGFVFLLTAGILYGGNYLYAYRQTCYIPELADVESATINDAFAVTATGEDVQQILQIHQMAVDCRNDMHVNLNTDIESRAFTLTYKLKNGKTVRRNYYFPIQEETLPLAKTIIDYESEPQNFVQGYLPCFANGTSQFNYASLQVYDENWDTSKTSDLSGAAVQKLIAAIMQDIEEGNLQPSVVYPPEAIEEAPRSCCANLEIRSKGRGAGTEADWSDYYETIGRIGYYYGYYTEYEDYVGYNDNYVWMSFNENCTNMIQAFKELGLIHSLDELRYTDTVG